MPGENLTRVEAQERASIVTVDSYEVALDLARGPERFGAETTVRFSATAGASTFIDLIAAEVSRIDLNGTELDPSEAFADSRIALPDLAAENTLTVVSEQRYTNTGEGLHRFVDPADDEVYLYSQFEVPDSRRVFAVFEQPDLKATFRFSVTAPARWQVVSNQTTPDQVPAGERDGVALATWTFAPTPVMSSYITALIAGPYHVERSELTSRDGRTIPLGVFCRESLAPHLDADYVFEKTREGFAFFEEQFDYPYPFEKYDQLFVPEFNAGAMENAGAITFTEAYVFRSQVTDAMRERRVVTILHELAHMWFGDLVTMRWWNDLWLNESFAEYMSTLAVAEATEWTECWTTFVASEKSWAYRQDQLPSTHPIVAEIRDLEDVLVNFDGITYAKGASVLKQLVAWVGREPFMQGVHDYFVKHHHSNTELPDLMTELEARSGRDLSDWTKLWLETAGVNTLRPAFGVDADGRFTSFTIEQSAADSHPTLRPHRIAVGLYELQKDRDRDRVSLGRVKRVELDIDGASTSVDELVGERRPALVILNDDDLTYAKIRLDDRSLETVAEHLGDLDDSLPRSLMWGALWDATRDGEFPPTHFVDLVLRHIAAESASTTLRTLLGQLVLAASSYVARDRRTAMLERVADMLWQLAVDAEPGSDRQFQFVKTFAQVAGTEEQLDAVARLLDGSALIDGLDIDTDLGWELLIALAAGGRIDASAIDARLAEDRTASGQQSAAHARAALPSPEDKRAAWDSVFADATAPNLIVRATGLGFTRARDLATLEPFVEHYFSALEDVWASRSYAIADELIDGFFPAPLADERLQQATQAWLDAHPEAPAALRRLVSEHLAGVERALNAQRADREV
ncbi:aminopeptidase N [Leucobacter tardus]|uniref:Aminopeptidase N n=1 Tax=Leucobacter tardus TaxID=501483 RepID=A0A939QEJ3_9MICO|nr:aminopeptidase N [Leucobacter tardus]MBO2989703.1 aminopeptidase N [Leucobacter tardus]